MVDFTQIFKRLNNENITLSGTNIGEQAYILSQSKSPVFFVASDNEHAIKIGEQLTALNVNNIVLTNFDMPFMLTKFQSKENKYSLIKALHKIVKKEANIIVTNIEGANLNVGDINNFKDAIISLQIDKSFDIYSLIEKLVYAGYRRVESVEQFGDFAVRGDLLDIYTCENNYPIRISFFDDIVEDMFFFDNVNLTRIESLKSFDIVPNRIVLQKGKEQVSLKNNIKDIINQSHEESLYEIGNMVGNDFPAELLTCFNSKNNTLLDTLENPIVVLQNSLSIKSTLEKYLLEINKKIDIKFKNKETNNLIKNKLNNYFFDVFAGKINKNMLYFDNFPFFKCDYIELECKKLNNYLRNIELLKSDFLLNELQTKTIVLCLNDDNTLKAVKDIFIHYNINYSTNRNDKGFVLTCEKYPYNICFKDSDTWFIGSTNFAHKKVITNSKSSKIKFLPKTDEYVVHDIYGIGLCKGIVTLKVMGSDKDFFKIIYAKDDVVYVPTENTDNLSLYMGNSDVKLNKLGGKEFELTKLKTNKAIEEMAKELLELYAKRAQSKGYKYSPDNYLMTEFENAFEYTETADQAQAIEDIKKDMTSGKVMDRLICGDVGYGKTEVALRACFKAFLDGKQTAVLAPTTILSLQHFMTFSKRLSSFGVRVAMLNRFKTSTEKEAIIKDLKADKFDVVCGTHSILSDNIGFKDLGLLILDEEQRFGVKAKEKLKSLKHNVDVITMSATPIPRTLNMAMLTLRDISIINTPPRDRLPVKTYVCPYEIDVCAEAIRKEISRGGQVLIVYNDIEKIYTFTSHLIKYVNLETCKFDVAHGKMKRVELENAIKRLYDGITNVFVSTTLIENGIDLPKANTLIVIDSQNLGLSQMYQLRGRVGRSNEQAYAYFTYPSNKTITIEATNRLEAIAENTDLGSGFKIAMRDMQLRGAGELLGKMQHGHMLKVGYDMYVKLLENAIKKLNGEKHNEIREVKIDIALNAKIPNEFISDETEKLKIYSKISNITSIEDQKAVVSQLRLNYGKLPREVLQLTNVSLIKGLAQACGVKQVIVNKDDYRIVYYPDLFDLNKVLKLTSKFAKISLVHNELPIIKLLSKDFSKETAQGYFIEYLKAQIALK